MQRFPPAIHRRTLLTAASGMAMAVFSAGQSAHAAAVPESRRSRAAETAGAARLAPLLASHGLSLGAACFLQITKAPG